MTVIICGVRAEGNGGPELQARVRAPGGGRKKLAEVDPELAVRLGKLVDPGTRGDPMSPLGVDEQIDQEPGWAPRCNKWIWPRRGGLAGGPRSR